MIIKSRYFPKKEYSTKEELFADFRANIGDLISFKKSTEQKSIDKGVTLSCKSLSHIDLKGQIKGLKMDDAYYYIGVNSTKFLDSHEDLHIDGLWYRSVKEQQGLNYLVADHNLTIADTIVRKEHVEMLIVKMPFALLGKSYPGDTEVLVYKFPKDKIVNDKAKEWLESGDAIEASVRMQYVTILFAMDSNDPEDATLKKNYDDYYSMIANKDEFEYIPYYFIIKEAKNVRESSLVIAGSNSVTGNLNRTTDPEKSILEIDPPTEQSTSVWDDFMLLPTQKKTIWDDYLKN